jgi:hypothetical protein
MHFRGLECGFVEDAGKSVTRIRVGWSTGPEYRTYGWDLPQGPEFRNGSCSAIIDGLHRE